MKTVVVSKGIKLAIRLSRQLTFISEEQIYVILTSFGFSPLISLNNTLHYVLCNNKMKGSQALTFLNYKVVLNVLVSRKMNYAH